MKAAVSIRLCDTGDNCPIHYQVSSETTQGPTVGWHLVELLDSTFKREFTFRYAMLGEMIDALQQVKAHLERDLTTPL